MIWELSLLSLQLFCKFKLISETREMQVGAVYRVVVSEGWQGKRINNHVVFDRSKGVTQHPDLHCVLPQESLPFNWDKNL